MEKAYFFVGKKPPETDLIVFVSCISGTELDEKLQFSDEHALDNLYH